MGVVDIVSLITFNELEIKFRILLLKHHSQFWLSVTFPIPCINIGTAFWTFQIQQLIQTLKTEQFNMPDAIIQSFISMSTDIIVAGEYNLTQNIS